MCGGTSARTVVSQCVCELFCRGLSVKLREELKELRKQMTDIEKSLMQQVVGVVTDSGRGHTLVIIIVIV